MLPWFFGTSNEYKIPALGGISWYVISACHTASPSPKLPIGVPSLLLTFEITLISGNSGKKVIPYGLGPGGSNSPKFLLKFINVLSSTFWFLKTKTNLSSQEVFIKSIWSLVNFSSIFIRSQN